MKVVLINSPIYDHVEGVMADNDYLPSFGLGYLATKIYDKNWDVIILDAVQLGLSIAQLLDRLNELEPNVIGINIFSVNIPIVQKIVERYRGRAKIVIGGQCTKFICDEIVCWETGNDIVVIIGEADLIICDVISDEVFETPIYISDSRKVYLVDSLSEYFPVDINALKLNRRLLNEHSVVNYYGLNEKSIITSRGCNYNCAFCGAAKSLNINSKIRLKDKKNIIEEIFDLINKDPKIQCIRILDDLFLRNLQSIQEAIEIFSQFNVSWRAMAHIKTFENISEELLLQMKISGCVELFIGIESGSDKIRNTINKLGTVEQVKHSTRKILKCGIDIKGYFIFGFPLETKTDMEMSFKVASSIYGYSLNSDGNFRTSVFQFRPYHGTILFNKYVEIELKLDYQENRILSTMIDRGHFNVYTKNYSECDDNILYDFIYKTSKLGEKND